MAWPKKNLGDICNVIGGGTPSKKNTEFYTGNIPWATVRDMKNCLISKTEFNITSEAVKGSSTNVIPSGNVIIATRVGLGKVCMLGQDTAINQDLRGIIPKSVKNLDVDFLYWWLKSVASTIVTAGTGATVQGVKLPFVKSLQVPLPPLAEQKRIVAIVDEAFAGIDAAVTHTENNLANARELFESYLNGVFTQKGDGWVEKSLSTIMAISHGFAFKGPDFKVSTNATKSIVLTPGNYSEYGELYFTEKNTKRFTGDLPKNYLFDVGELTIVMTDLSSKMKILGQPAFIDQPNILHNQRIGRVIFKSSEVLSRLVYYYLRSRYASGEIKKTSTGTMVRHTAPKRILALNMAFPPTEIEQVKIVSVLDGLETETKRLETIYQQKLKALAELKQSVLQKAFAGELITRPEKEIEEAVA